MALPLFDCKALAGTRILLEQPRLRAHSSETEDGGMVCQEVEGASESSRFKAKRQASLNKSTTC